MSPRGFGSEGVREGGREGRRKGCVCGGLSEQIITRQFACLGSNEREIQCGLYI